MKDLIEREAAIKAIKNLYMNFDFDDADAYDKAMDGRDYYAIGLMDAIDAVDDILSSK